jgi:hypothetical protein
MRSRIPAALAILLAFFVCGALAAAQCPQPDKLDNGPCCAQAQAFLPGFPKFSQDSLEICWRNCNVDQVIRYRADWKNIVIAPPSGPPCGERSVVLDLTDTGTGILTWTGTLRLIYSRTWGETDPAGFPIQVWRFLVNGDLRATLGTVGFPCPFPICAAANNGRVRFTGYVDYAGSCALVPTLYQHAWMLTHACDAIDHRAGFPRAGVFHPDRTYTFVGPAAGFVPGPIQPLEGTPGSAFEDIRRRVFPPLGTTGPITCRFEERINFALAQINQFCQCGLAGAPPQFLLGNLNLLGLCGSSVTTPGGPFLPGFLSMGIGSWTLPGIYPGVEQVRWNCANYDTVDGCTGVLTNEVFFGATTINGYPAFQLLSGGGGGPLPLTFIDQSNSLPLPSGPGVVMNVPYISDQILNLNH